MLDQDVALLANKTNIVLQLLIERLSLSVANDDGPTADGGLRDVTEIVRLNLTDLSVGVTQKCYDMSLALQIGGPAGGTTHAFRGLPGARVFCRTHAFRGLPGARVFCRRDAETLHQ